MVHWFIKLHTCASGGAGLIPGLGRSHMPCGIAKEKVKAVKGKEQSQIGGDEHDN